MFLTHFTINTQTVPLHALPSNHIELPISPKNPHVNCFKKVTYPQSNVRISVGGKVRFQDSKLLVSENGSMSSLAPATQLLKDHAIGLKYASVWSEIAVGRKSID
jgi:hypothetical protein